MSSSLPAGAADCFANDNATLQLVPVLIALSKSTSALLGLRLAAIGLRNGQDEALMALSPSEPMTKSALAAKLGVRPTTAGAILGHLGEKGLSDGHDNTFTQRDRVTVTPAGILAQQKVRQLHRQLEADLLESTSGAQDLLEDLSRLQNRLTQLLSTMG